jgi:regulator of protease activity HflC (stomatin/prohibitin superfamily)
MAYVSWPLLIVIIIVGLSSFFTVQTAQAAVITRFGKFLRVAEPGLNWKWPVIDRVAGRVSLRVNQIALTMETKTKDNVFVTIPISVQNRVRPEKVYDAFYRLSDPMAQIQAYVEQVILGHVPGMTLDEVFASQSGIAAAVKQELDVDMAGFG